MSDIEKLEYPTRSGQLDPELAMNWGASHELSAGLTLLRNIESLLVKLDLSGSKVQFREVGMLQVTEHVASSPDGLLLLGPYMTLAVEIKSPFQQGRARPARKINWKHYVQVRFHVIN